MHTGCLQHFGIGHFISGIARISGANAAIEAIFYTIIGIFNEAPEIDLVAHQGPFYLGGFSKEGVGSFFSS